MQFEHLAGKRALGEDRDKDYTDWAESLLGDGVESRNAAILASLGLDKHPDPDEVEKYFQKCVRELSLSLPAEADGLLVYARYLCEQIISGDIEPEKGLAILNKFYSRSGYKELYSIWDWLSEDLWSIRSSYGPLFNIGLTAENVASYIQDVAAQFVTLSQSQLPQNFFSLSACTDCGYVGERRLEPVEKLSLLEKICRLFLKRRQTYQTVCAQCGAPNPMSMRDYQGRKLYLSQR